MPTSKYKSYRDYSRRFAALVGVAIIIGTTISASLPPSKASAAGGQYYPVRSSPLADQAQIDFKSESPGTLNLSFKTAYLVTDGGEIECPDQGSAEVNIAVCVSTSVVTGKKIRNIGTDANGVTNIGSDGDYVGRYNDTDATDTELHYKLRGGGGDCDEESEIEYRKDSAQWWAKLWFSDGDGDCDHAWTELPNPAGAPAANDAERGNRAVIRYNDKNYADSSPWTDGDIFEERNGESCKNQIRIDGGKTTLYEKAKDSFGACLIKTAKGITLNDPNSMGAVTAYKINADTIFAPACYRIVADNNLSSHPEHLLDCYFKKFPQGAANANDNMYMRWNNSGWDDTKFTGGDVSKTFIVANENKIVGYGFFDGDLADKTHGPIEHPIVFANNGEITTPDPVFHPAFLNNPDGDPGSDPVAAPDGDAADISKTCESENPGMIDWVLCGITGFIDRMLVGENGTGGLLAVVDSLLNIEPSQYADPQLRTAWSYFRNIASFLLVLIGLVMIIGQAVSKE